jgi:hypothetical protein
MGEIMRNEGDNEKWGRGCEIKMRNSIIKIEILF